MRGALAITCVLVGCGDNAVPLPASDAAGSVDAPDIDALDVDAAPDAPGSGTVRVRAWLDHSRRGVPPAPRPGTQVWVNAPDGTPIAYALTGAGGDVVVPVLQGSTVSAVFPQSGTWNPILTSYVDVQPGITLDFAEYWRGDITGDAQFEVQVPPHPDATSYVAQTPFDEAYASAPSFTVEHDTSVAPLSSIDELLIMARRAGGGIVAAGLISPLDLEQTPVVLPAWQEAAVHGVQATGIPSGFEAGARAWTYRRGLVQEGSGELPFDGVAQLRVSPFADRVVTMVSSEEVHLWRSVTVGSEPGAPGVNIDFDALAVSRIYDIGFDKLQRNVQWAVDVSRPNDVTRLTVLGAGVSWQFLVPPERTQLAIPQLPVELAAYELQGDRSAEIVLHDSSGWSGYADVLATVPWERGRQVELGAAYESYAVLYQP